MPKVLEVAELKEYERDNSDTLAHSRLEALQTYGGHGECLASPQARCIEPWREGEEM